MAALHQGVTFNWGCFFYLPQSIATYTDSEFPMNSGPIPLCSPSLLHQSSSPICTLPPSYLVLQVLLKLVTHSKIHDLLITVNKTCKTIRLLLIKIQPPLPCSYMWFSTSLTWCSTTKDMVGVQYLHEQVSKRQARNST